MKEHKGRLEAVEETVKGIVAEGRRDAETTKASILKQAEAEAEAIKNRALAEINRAKDQRSARSSTRWPARSSAATERVLGSGLERRTTTASSGTPSTRFRQRRKGANRSLVKCCRQSAGDRVVVFASRRPLP